MATKKQSDTKAARKAAVAAKQRAAQSPQRSARDTWTMRLDVAPCLAAFPPMKGRRKPKPEELELGDAMPTTLKLFLEDVGFGRFGDGFLRVLPPRELEPLLAQWLGGSKPTRIPFATTALGDILYFRDLRTADPATA